MHRLIPRSQLHVYHGGHLELGTGAERLCPWWRPSWMPTSPPRGTDNDAGHEHPSREGTRDGLLLHTRAVHRRAVVTLHHRPEVRRRGRSSGSPTRSPDCSPSPEEPSASPGSPYRVLAHESTRKLQPSQLKRRPSSAPTAPSTRWSGACRQTLCPGVRIPKSLESVDLARRI